MTLTQPCYNTVNRPAYPKILLSILQTDYVRIFRFLTRSFADAPPISQNKTTSKVNFSIIQLVKNSVRTHIFNLIQTHYTRTTLFCLRLRKSFSIENRRISKNNAPCVLLSLMPTRPFLNVCCLVRVCFLGFMHSSSSLLVLSSHLSPTALIQTRHV